MCRKKKTLLSNLWIHVCSVCRNASCTTLHWTSAVRFSTSAAFQVRLRAKELWLPQEGPEMGDFHIGRVQLFFPLSRNLFKSERWQLTLSLLPLWGKQRVWKLYSLPLHHCLHRVGPLKKRWLTLMNYWWTTAVVSLRTLVGKTVSFVRWTSLAQPAPLRLAGLIQPNFRTFQACSTEQ